MQNGKTKGLTQEKPGSGFSRRSWMNAGLMKINKHTDTDEKYVFLSGRFAEMFESALYYYLTLSNICSKILEECESFRLGNDIVIIFRYLFFITGSRGSSFLQ